MASCCPKICQCKWRSGKQWVTCSDAKFIDIPRGLDPSTQVLNLEHNNLKILFTDAFVDRSLVNLQKVFLSHCKLVKLENGSLRRLANLIEIDLSYNYLTSVPSAALQDVSGLRELLMKENKLTYLPMDAFQTTPDLVHLDVSFNNITSISTNAFRSLTRLEVLKVSGNRISTVRLELLKPMVALHGFHVHFNPWKCDCVLRPLRQYMLKRNIATSIPPKCHTPERLKGRQWKNLQMNEFVCAPEVTPVSQSVMAAYGENVSLACAVNNESEVEVTWQLGDRILSSSTRENALRYKVLELLVPDHDYMKKMSNLTIAKADVQDEGTYKCVVENKAGRAETNMTLMVAEEIIEEPLVAINEMFIAGAVFGALIFVLLAVIFIGMIMYRKGRHYDSERMKISNLNKLQLPLKSSEDDINSMSMEIIPKQQYEYKSIPTSELVEESALNHASEDEPKLSASSVNENILNDLDKPDDEIQVKNITNNIVHEEMGDNVSYVEIPKATLNPPNQDQNPLLKNLAQQCRDEILRRKGMKRSNSSFREKNNQAQFPDLLDFQSENRLDRDFPRRSVHLFLDINVIFSHLETIYTSICAYIYI
ncbi:UNVERIFIED_CONTAM: hypothetical protein GTU68_019061 [Idotea baltica]|nr:hypothetical protein [Idotea baltica]